MITITKKLIVLVCFNVWSRESQYLHKILFGTFDARDLEFFFGEM
jgi:hypothetical protein